MDDTTHWDIESDVVSVGSGWGGLVTAIVAHDLGMRTLVVERATRLGGTSARSAGGTWIPMNKGQIAAGIVDDREAALTYFLSTNQGHAQPEAREITDAYVDAATEVVQYLEEHTPLHFDTVSTYPDYHMSFPGSRYGRTLVPASFDAKKLGSSAELVEKRLFLPPIGLQETAAVGGYGVLRLSPQELSRRDKEDIRYGGAAGTAALVLACLDRNIPLLLQHRVRHIVREAGHVVGIEAEYEGQIVRIHARKGVILATGGAEWDEVSNRRNIRRPFSGPATNPESDGDGHRMASELGLPLALMSESHWVVAFRLPGDVVDGKQLHRSCLLERSSPHSIIVNRHGYRFVNEAMPYNDLVNTAVHSWNAAQYEFPNDPMFLIVDQQFRERYALAGVFPGMPDPDWIVVAPTLQELAGRMGIHADHLQATVKHFNQGARLGKDQDFHRGEDPYERFNGDQLHAPNPCLGTLEVPPFYGLPLYVSTFGHKGGVITNRHAQVLDTSDQPVPGLYAVGNVAASFHHNLGYTGGGILGRALIFGYLAALSCHNK